MRANHILIGCAVAFTCLTLPARAAQQGQSSGGGGLATVFPWESSVVWPGVLGSAGGSSLMCAGDIDGDLRPDVLVRGASAPAGSTGAYEIVYLGAPWIGQATVRLVQTANFFDFEPGASASGPGRLALVSSAGLSLLAWNEASTPPLSETLVTAEAPWSGAVIVRCADLDGLPGGDYVGVGSDERTVVLRAGSGPSAQSTTFVLDADAVDVAPLQWEAGGPQEVAVLSESSLQVRAASGLLLASFPLASPGVTRMAVVHFGSSGADRIAWAIPGAAGQAWGMSLVRRASPQVEGPVGLFWSDVVGLAAADMDEDGDEDLAVARASDRKVRVYTSGAAQSLLTVFSTSRTQVVSHASLLPADALPNAATPLFADLGNDGHADLLVPVHGASGSTFEILRSRPQSGISSEQAFVNDVNLPFCLDVDTSGTQATLAFWIHTNDYSTQATHLQVVAWTQNSAQEPLNTTSDGPARLYPIAPSQATQLAPTWQVYGLDLPIPGGAVCAMPIRWLEVRLVRLENGALMRAWPTYTCAVLARHVDYCTIDNGDATNVELELWPRLECNQAGTCTSGIGSWPAEAITRRRKADPPPGVLPRIPVTPVVVGPIPAGG